MKRGSFVAFMVALCVMSSFAQSLKEVPRPKSTNDTGQKKGTSPKQAPAVVTNQYTAAQDQRADNDKAGTPDNDHAQKWIVRSAVVQAASAAIVVGLTFALVWYSHKGWKVAKVSADAAKKSADATGEMLHAMDRAWVRAKIEFDRWFLQPDKSLMLTYKVTLENVGGAVANNARLRTGTILLQRNEQRTRAELLAVQNALEGTGDFEIALFPNDPHSFFIYNILTEPLYMASAISITDGTFRLRPVFLGIVDYFYPTSERVHTTRVAYAIQRRVTVIEGMSPWLVEPTIGEELNPANSWFAPYTSGGNEAD